MKQKQWNDYLWIFSLSYLILGFFNIIFAWLGLICFVTPLVLTFMGYGKIYCNRYCGRGQLFSLLGKKLSIKREIPKWIKSKAFRYGFLIFFFMMFFQMLWMTFLVFSDKKSLSEVITVLWTFKFPWQFANHFPNINPWVIQFSYGFYSVMLTSTILGLITMVLFKPRSWCVYCPMGTMTQLISKQKYHHELKNNSQ